MQGAACTAKVAVHPDSIDSKEELLPNNARVHFAAGMSQILTKATLSGVTVGSSRSVDAAGSSAGSEAIRCMAQAPVA